MEELQLAGGNHRLAFGTQPTKLNQWEFLNSIANYTVQILLSVPASVLAFEKIT